MVVNLREPQILVRPLAQLFHCAFHRQTAALHRLQKFSYVPFIHDRFLKRARHSSSARLRTVLLCPAAPVLRTGFVLDAAPSQSARATASAAHGFHLQILREVHTCGFLWEIIIGIRRRFSRGTNREGFAVWAILVDLIVGIVGSILGGWIFGLLGLAAYGLIGQLVWQL